MDTIDFKPIFDKMKYGDDAFQELMRKRIRRILLVLPQYDAWILEHDTKLTDQIVGEYHQLNLTTVPRITTVSDGEEALKLLRKENFELMIIGRRTGDISPAELAKQAKETHPGIAVLMLFSSKSELITTSMLLEREWIDSHFVWTGDSRLLLAMIKYIEDLRNAPSDTKGGRVGVILVVEDSVPFYSAYLPLLYSEMLTLTQRLIAEEMNDKDKYWRMRTRPKVLLARDWNEAIELGKTYRDALIGIVSDISFMRDEQFDIRAGFSLIDRFREMGIGVPVLFQSSDNSMAAEAEKHGAQFQCKLAANLHQGIRRFILKELGFGDFIFHDKEGREIHRVKTLRELEQVLHTLPEEIFLFHADRNEFSRWLAARGEYNAADRIRKVRMEDFPDASERKKFLAKTLRELRETRHRGRLIDFSFNAPGTPGSVIRYGSGSLGGKGRGLAFFNALLSAIHFQEKFSPLTVEIPHTLIIATGEFDKFMDENKFPLDSYSSDEELRREFLNAPINETLRQVLSTYLEREAGPMAVRSSTLLEDSQSIPFAGVYDTYMVPPAGKDERLNMLFSAVKLVWASTYSLQAARYREALGVGRDEEKMAVVIQRAAGRQYGTYWFPRLSGTAQSLNFYPIGPMEREDGASRIAAGLGRSVVEGDRGFMFCPHFPSIPWGTEEDRWRKGQKNLWAINCGEDAVKGMDLFQGDSATLTRLSIRDAEKLGVLGHIISTWDAIGHRIVDGTEFYGPRVVDFRDILAYDWLPLAPLLGYLLRLCSAAMGIPVELEFALDWKGNIPQEATFSLLQVRPLIPQSGSLDTISVLPSDNLLLLHSKRAFGHGVISGIHDVVWIDPELYSPMETEAVREKVAALTEQLAAEGRNAILIGPGRWGSRDKFLGIPVSWTQVRQAKLIVEVIRGHEDPEPSQGSHFFHNLVALGVGYAHVSLSGDEEFISWNILKDASSDEGTVRHSIFPEPLDIIMDGKKGTVHAALRKVME
ncbi:MAG: hypothetical protein B0D92_02115 [Spirochaeta sp. LUC14_002_19_P3]|nr:MAG: hypothetical protein B0D92_02115 [Spirochaeta sp. LUC14_002_19_P3]